MQKRTKIIWIIAGVVALIIVSGYVINARNKSANPAIRTVTAERVDIAQDVSFSGNFEANKMADLSFETPGTIKEILVNVGDRVKAGQKLIQLDTRSAALQVAQARATLVSSQDQALLNLQKAQQELSDTNAQNVKTLDKYKLAVTDAKAALLQAKDAYNAVKDESGEDSSTAKTKYSSVLSAEAAYHSAQKVYGEGKISLAKSANTATKAAEIANAQYKATTQASVNTAGISALQATEALAKLSLTKSALYAPFAGIVTQKDIEVGELASSAKSVITVQGESASEISANVPESDAVKIKVGQNATVTFDAFPTTEQWQAEVISVAPAAKIIGGIPTYEIKVSVKDVSEKIKTGLTANVVVHTAKKLGVIGIQRRAIITKGDKQFVNILGTDEKTQEKEVTTDLLGSDGIIEVASGLNVGDRVVIEATK
jgi:RND family efflux transporter MFP subunit